MNTNKQKTIEYLILAARVLIVLTLFSYGYSKLTGNQFGLTELEQQTPVIDLSLFKLAWHLFSHEPYKSFIGISQLIAGILILYKRTIIIGVLISFTIFVNILFIDITYIQMPGFYWRISYYLLIHLAILWYYKERVLKALQSVWITQPSNYKFHVMAYLALPLVALVFEVVGFLPQLLFGLITNHDQTIAAMAKIPGLMNDIMQKFGQ